MTETKSVGSAESDGCIRIGINGFGRIGRALMRAVIEKHLKGDKRVVVAAVNDPHMQTDTLVELLQYDSTHGRLSVPVSHKNDCVDVNKGMLVFLHLTETDPSAIHWDTNRAEYIVECTGRFTSKVDASMHLTEGVKRVLISAYSKDAPLIVLGANEEKYDPLSMSVVAMGSCTTNCLAPVCRLLNDSFKIASASITTVHSMTNSQKPLDVPSKIGERCGRSAMQNIIPYSTGAICSILRVFPELTGKINGIALRVPIMNVSVLDLFVNLEKECYMEDINKIFIAAANSQERGSLIGVVKHNAVSHDFNTTSKSAWFDPKACIALNRKFYKLSFWYDNEFGYANRLLDMVAYFHSREVVA